VIPFTPGADGRVPLGEVLKLLAEEERISVLVEGGARVHGSVFDQELADRVVAYIAPRVVGGERAPSAVAGRGVARLAAAAPLTGVTVERAGDDIVVSGYCVRGQGGASPVKGGE
jgi:diaminohydroxyphosphoribosylaminopyrimidine deaminase/5-amino-6-(5-phosphoribosylamino)uracil reductase